MVTIISISSLKGFRPKVALMQNKSRFRNTGTTLYSLLKGNFTFIKKRNDICYIESWLVSRHLMRVPWNKVMCWSPCWSLSFYSEEYIQFSLFKYTYAPSFYCSGKGSVSLRCPSASLVGGRKFWGPGCTVRDEGESRRITGAEEDILSVQGSCHSFPLEHSFNNECRVRVFPINIDAQLHWTQR